jgi:two-component system sensor histidine kinase VicK
MIIPKLCLNFLRCLHHCIMVFICLTFILLISACRQKKETPTGYSEAFKPVFDSVTILFGTNRLAPGLHYLDSSLKNIHNATIDDKFRAYAFHYTYEYKEKKNYKKALLYADSMLNLANQNSNDAQYIVEANFIMGDAYFNMQRYNDAYQYFFKGYTIGKNNFNHEALADYNYRMGMIMYKTENFKVAVSYFKKSYQFLDKTNSNFNAFYSNQEMLDNIALSFKHNNQTDSALVYFNKALKFIDQYGPQFPDKIKRIEVANGVIYGNEAEVLILNGNYTEAKELLKKSIAINMQKHYDYNDAELAEIKLAQLYYDHNENELLFTLLNNMRPQVDTIKNEDAAANWNRLMSRYYHRKNDLPKALGYLEAYNTIKDSITQKLNLLKESDVNKQIDNYEKQLQIEQLSNNNKFQRIYIVVISVFSLMALIIISLIYRNWKVSKNDVLKVNAVNRQKKEQNIILENTLNELQHHSREKDRILRTVAHDLRNPLGGIAALTAMMAEDDYTDEQKEQINLIKETSSNTLELINELLEATHIHAVALNPEQVDVNSLVYNSVELLRFKATEKEQRIFLESLSRGQELYISREKIWRVISNLVSNAIKFSPAGASIFVRVTKEAEHIIIAVEDNGIGIPEDLRDEVFHMFTQAQRPGTSGEKSFGLGLSICRQIIEKFQGKIWFESKAQGGTIFFISLPITAPNVDTTGLPQKICVPMA